MGKACGVQLSTQGLFYPVAGDRCLLNTCVWISPCGLSEGFLYDVDLEFISL
jgi:hypothetical protein